MRKNHFILPMLILAMIVSVISCKKTVEMPKGGGTTKLEKKEPIEDQLRVKTKVETFVYGTDVQNYYYTALVSRLENITTTYNESTTKAIMVFNSFVPSLTEQDYDNIYNCYKYGGSVVIITPTGHNFGNIFRVGIINAAYKDNVLKYNTEGYDREQWMEYVGKKLFEIASGIDNPENVLAVSLGFHKTRKYVLNNISDAVNPLTITNYQYGVMADGVVKWISDTQTDEKESFKSFAGKGDNLTDLATAEILTNEYGIYVNGEAGWSDYYSGVVQNILTTYVSHSFDYNRDYYQVDQNITFRNADPKLVYDINDHTLWWGYNGNDGVDRLYIESQDNFSSKMWLSMSGGGNTVIYESHPQSANGSTTTTGVSHTIGGDKGSSMGPGSRSLVGNFAQMFANSMSTQKSYETTTGKSCTINDLTVTKSTKNEDGYEKVNWDYQFRDTYTYSGSSKGSGETTYFCWWAAPLAITDCSQQNSILYYVDNPSGDPTVNCYNKWRYVFSWDYKGSGTDNTYHYYTEGDKTTAFTMSCPNRYVERWGISCVEYGDIAGNPAMISMFETRITDDIIGGSNNKFNEVGGVDENDLTEANSLLNLFMNDLDIMSESYAASGFTGIYKFKLEGESSGRTIYKSDTIR